MKVTVTATTDFVHGKLNVQRGQAVELPLALAKDLRAAGHVDFDDGAPGGASAKPADDEQDPAPDNKMASSVENMAAPAAEKKGKAKA